MKIGLSTHLFVHETLCPLWIRKIKEYGFRFIEIWGMRPHFDYKKNSAVSMLKDFLDKEGIRAISLHAPFYLHVKDAKERKWLSISSKEEKERKKIIKEIKEVMDVMRVFETDVIAIHCGLKVNREAEGDNIPKALYKSIEELMDYSMKSNIKIALENAPNQYSTTLKILDIVKKYHSKSLGMCLDLGHANVSEDPVKAIKKASGHIFSIHASDNDGTEDSHLSPFQGKIKWKSVRDTLFYEEYDGPFMLELRNYGDYDEVLSQARDFVQKCFRINL